MFQPVQSGFNKTKETLGVPSKTLLVLLNVIICGGITLLIMWLRSRKSNDFDLMSVDPSEIATGHDQSEF